MVRLSHESLANVSRHSRDIRETLARCSPDEIANIYYHRPPHNVLMSCECRAKVVRLSHDGFARNDKPRKIKILASIETSDQESTTLLEGRRGLEGTRLLEGVMLLCGVGLLNGSKY